MNIRYPIYEGVYRILTFGSMQVYRVCSIRTGNCEAVAIKQEGFNSGKGCLSRRSQFLLIKYSPLS